MFTLDLNEDCTNPELQRSGGSHKLETHAIKINVIHILVSQFFFIPLSGDRDTEGRAGI